MPPNRKEIESETSSSLPAVAPPATSGSSPNLFQSAVLSPISLASQLPFDILTRVFDEYALMETAEYPTETLLLVCKWWQQTALNYTRLWATINVKSRDVKFWCGCLPQRLRRCHPGSLLDISIAFPAVGTNKFESRPYEAVLATLTGQDGEVARRWRKFSASCLYHKVLGKYLGIPTPNLQEIRLTHVQINALIFPHTPSLKVFYAHDVILSAFPNLTTAVDVAISGFTSAYDQDLVEAPNITTLRLLRFISLTGYSIARKFRHLKYLEIRGYLSNDEVCHFASPALEQLSLIMYEPSHVHRTLSCKGVPFKQI